MSQLVGRKLSSADASKAQYNNVSVENSDHFGNGAMHVMVFGGGLTSRSVVSGNYTYVGEAAPGSLPTEAKWRVTRIENIGGAGTSFITTHAYVPASGSTPAKYSGFDHIFNNYAALTYA